MPIFPRESPNGGVEFRWGIGRNNDSGLIAGYPRLLDVRTAKCQKQLPMTMQCRLHSRRRTIECLFVTACSMDKYAEEKRTEKNLIVCSGISEAETTNNKRMRSTFCIEAMQTRSIVRPLCNSWASCYYQQFMSCFFLTLDLCVTVSVKILRSSYAESAKFCIWWFWSVLFLACKFCVCLCRLFRCSGNFDPFLNI